ncbi:MAG: hypothetical protein WCL39_03465 [Armatimonadota bacterium]
MTKTEHGTAPSSEAKSLKGLLQSKGVKPLTVAQVLMESLIPRNY